MTDAAVADRPVEPVELPAVSAGVPIDIGTPHIGEPDVEQPRIPAVTKTALMILSLTQARPSPRRRTFLLAGPPIQST